MATAQGSMSLPAPDIQQSSDPSWEGDKMFNIYIYDYCNKRGFRKTARELLAEAELAPDSTPPINAKQGLLFEWWSVFWVLFTAKSNGTGTEDAIVYTQHQIQQAGLRQAARPLNHPLPPRMMNGPFPLGQPNGSTPAGQNPPPSQAFTALMPGQRPPPHRGPNGVNPYQSPTISHAAQNQGPNPQNPMHQLGPSPHMAHMARAGMLPPNANMASVPPTHTPPFSQLARSPSRPATPGQMMHPSPSLVDRQNVTPQEASLHQELIRMNQSVLTTIKQEMGIPPDKDLASLTYEEKSRIVNLARQRSANASVRKNGPGAPQGPAGPSSLVQQLPGGQRPSGQPQPPQLPQQGPPQQPPQQRVTIKRNSTSPGEEHGQLPNNESSPPDRKRVRRSSVSMDQVPPAGYPHQPQQAQQMMNGGMMRGPGPMPGAMNNFPPHGPPGMPNPGMSIPMGAQIPGTSMSPAMGGPRVPNMMQLQYHQGLHAATKGLAMANLPGVGAGTPTPGDPPFNPGPGPGQPPFSAQNNRMVQNKPMGMMPPPSPAGGPTTKDQQQQSKDVKPVVTGAEGSPRNQPPNASQPSQVNTAPPTPSATSSSMTAPSPSAPVVNGTPTINPATATTALPELPANFMTSEFIQSVATTMEDFDPQALFREDEGLNFEQFREWFNPDDMEIK